MIERKNTIEYQTFKPLQLSNLMILEMLRKLIGAVLNDTYLIINIHSNLDKLYIR
jgi:hypothetical protein